jgi:hypothetical protein
MSFSCHWHPKKFSGSAPAGLPFINTAPEVHPKTSSQHPMHRSRLVLALVACALLATAAFVRAESMEAEFELEAETEAQSGAELYPGDLDLRLNGLRSIEQAQAQAELNQIKVWRGASVRLGGERAWGGVR